MRPDQAELRRLFNYSPSTGLVTRRVRTANRHVVGEIVGTPGGRGYLQVTVYSRKYPLHCLIWCWLYGTWPTTDIDHKNRDRADNRKVNLRLTTRSENNHNSGLSRRNTSGHKGVCWDKARQQWIAHITTDGKQIFLGRFTDPELAGASYRAAKALYHPTAIQAHQ